MNSSSKAEKSKKSDEERLEEIRKEIRELPYSNDRVGQAFIMFTKVKPPKK